MKKIRNLLIIFLLALVIILFSSGTVKADITEYPVWVNGEQFTSEKTTIVCGEGTATYDNSSKTLFLNNATITKSYEYQPYYESAIYSELDELTINLDAMNTIKPTKTYVDGIDAPGGKNIIIEGYGYLEMQNVYYGTYIGSWDVEGGDFAINNATVYVNHPEAAGIWVNRNIDMNSCHLTVEKDTESYNGIVSNIGGTITATNSVILVDTYASAIHMGNGDSSSHTINIDYGNVTLKSKNSRGINVEPYVGGDTETINGFFSMTGGTLDITSAIGGTNIENTNTVLEQDVYFEKGESLHDTGNIVLKTKEPEVVLPFTDVPEGKWYYNAVKYVYKNGIIKGLTNTTFGPNDNLTRGMLVTILNRMEGDPKAKGESKFSDVQDSSKYYYNSVIWASENKIVSGYSNGRFGATDNITRQDLAVILYKYAKFKGKDVSKTSDLAGFTDVSKISNYALPQVRWAVATGIIKGNADKTLKPKGNATRAEVAGMIMNYCEKVGK